MDNEIGVILASLIRTQGDVRSAFEAVKYSSVSWDRPNMISELVKTFEEAESRGWVPPEFVQELYRLENEMWDQAPPLYISKDQGMSPSSFKYTVILQEQPVMDYGTLEEATRVLKDTARKTGFPIPNVYWDGSLGLFVESVKLYSTVWDR